MICILDACAAIEVVLGRPKMKAIAEVLRESERVLAPTLYTYEVSNVLWKYHTHDHIPVQVLLRKLRHACELVDHYVDAGDLLEKALKLACELEHPVYDTMYLAACQKHEELLVSLDSRLSGLARHIDMPVIHARAM